MTDEQVADAETRTGIEASAFAEQVKGAVIWRSGSQLVAQLITWAATFLVIRLLAPGDYGLFAMTQVVLVFLNLVNGYGFASALIQSESIDDRRVRQLFGMLVLVNGGLAATQLLLAPFAAAYFREPMVADLLRVQALLYVSTPFNALAHALLGRRIDFKTPAKVNLVAAALSAASAVGCAAAGMGVWTLVVAAIVLFWTRAVGVTVAARCFVWPSFRFDGAGDVARYGGALALVQVLWFIQSQADILIAGRLVGPHELGIYTTSLFLTQILASKFVPPLNDVAFASYSRMQADRDTMQGAFLKAVRLIMLVAMPFYLGMAATAEPLVLTVLGPQWAATADLVPILALAMPMMTLQILFAPATNALGRPGIALRTGLAGAILLPAAFLAGIHWGLVGLAWAWLVGMAMLLAVTIMLSLPAIGASWRGLAAAVAPGLAASLAMAAAVALLDSLLRDFGPGERMALLAPFGALVYAGLLLLFARPLVEEVLALVRPRRPAAQTL